MVAIFDLCKHISCSLGLLVCWSVDLVEMHGADVAETFGCNIFLLKAYFAWTTKFSPP